MTFKVAPQFTAELSPYDGSTTKTLGYATKGFSSAPGDTPANTPFDGVIAQPIDIARTMFSNNATQGRATTALGQLVLSNPDGALDPIIDYAFDGRAIAVRRSTKYRPTYPTDFSPIIVGTVKGVPTASLTDLRFTVRDRLADVAAAPLQT